MHENDELQEFDLDDILSEFSEEPPAFAGGIISW